MSGLWDTITGGVSKLFGMASDTVSEGVDNLTDKATSKLTSSFEKSMGGFFSNFDFSGGAGIFSTAIGALLGFQFGFGGFKGTLLSMAAGALLVNWLGNWVKKSFFSAAKPPAPGTPSVAQKISGDPTGRTPSYNVEAAPEPAQ